MKEDRNGIAYKRLIEQKGCIRNHTFPCERLRLGVRSSSGGKFCLIVGLEDNSSGWRRQS